MRKQLNNQELDTNLYSFYFYPQIHEGRISNTFQEVKTVYTIEDLESLFQNCSHLRDNK